MTGRKNVRDGKPVDCTDKYNRLVGNTLLFAISSFSSKILSFLLMPFFTRVFGLGEYGDADIITKWSQLFLPLVSVGIAGAVIRFGLEKSADKTGVFTCGLIANIAGSALFFCFWPLVDKIPGMTGYTALLYVYVIASNLRNLCSQFVRSRQYTRLYAVDGVVNTLLYLTFILVFIVGFKWGITGYVLATPAADLCSAVLLFLTARLHRYLDLRHLRKNLMREMLRYALPLIPTSMFWWITNTSDHVFILAMMGSEANGLYTAAYKVPNVIMLVSTLFTEAWQLSAVTDGGRGSPGRSRFFSKVFLSYQGFLFMCAAVLVYASKLVMMILTLSSSSAFIAAWRFIPILVVATVYSCFVSFLGSVYMVEKRSVESFLTMMTGALLNLIFNWFMIPVWGQNGAAFATFLSYFIVFILRAVRVQHYIRFDLHIGRMAVTMTLLTAETAVMLAQTRFWTLICAVLCAVILLYNFAPILAAMRHILRRRRTA